MRTTWRLISAATSLLITSFVSVKVSASASGQPQIWRPQNVRSIDPTLYLQKKAANDLPDHFYQNQKRQDQSECVYYEVPELEAIKDQFPPSLTVATILEGDTEALEAMRQINASGIVPSGVSARGTQPDSLAGTGLEEGYNVGQDPDCWWTGSGCRTPKHQGLVDDTYFCPEPGTWGLTVDDGPACGHEGLYDFWKEKNQKASLFYIGTYILSRPLEAQRGILDGHHICSHTWSHKYMTALTSDEVFAELWYTMKIMKAVMGITPTCWRPPFGDVDDRVRGIAQALGLRTIAWSDDTKDYAVRSGQSTPAEGSASQSAILAKATTEGRSRGVIVLEHEIDDTAANATVALYDRIVEAWGHVMPVSSCLNETTPYAEKGYVYPDFRDYVAGNREPSGIPTGSSIRVSSASMAPDGTLFGGGESTASTRSRTRTGTRSRSTAAAEASTLSASSNNPTGAVVNDSNSTSSAGLVISGDPVKLMTILVLTVFVGLVVVL